MHRPRPIEKRQTRRSGVKNASPNAVVSGATRGRGVLGHCPVSVTDVPPGAIGAEDRKLPGPATASGHCSRSSTRRARAGDPAGVPRAFGSVARAASLLSRSGRLADRRGLGHDRAQIVALEQQKGRRETDEREADADPEGQAVPARGSFDVRDARRQQMVGASRGHRRQDRQPSAPPICWLVLISPDASPASPEVDARERRDRDRDEGEAEPDPDEDEADEQVSEVRAVDGDLGEVPRARRRARSSRAASTGFTPTRVTSACEPRRRRQRRSARPRGSRHRS